MAKQDGIYAEKLEDVPVLLISGTGGAYTIRGKDLENSLFDSEKREEIIQSYYIQNDKCLVPEKAYYYKGNEKKYLLRKTQSNYPPLVTRTLENILEKNNLEFESIPCDTIWEKREFTLKHYKCVCLSTTFMWSEKMIDVAIKWILSNTVSDYIVLGGHYSSIKYEYILYKYPAVNYIIIGDGETALPMLLKKLLGELNVEILDIPNIVYLQNNILEKSAMKYEDMNNIEKVSYEGKYERLSYESVRGCAYGCKFCTWDAGIKCFRFKSAERIVSDVKEYIKENGIKRIEINDSTFFFPFSRIEKVIDGFIDLGIHWKAHCRADVPWTDELIDKLNRSNCDILQIGFESMCDRILCNMNKRTTCEMNRFTNEMLSKTKIDTVVSFIVGFPDETVEEFKYTWDYILNDFSGHFYLFVFEMEDKSLELYKERKKYGFELFEDKEDCLHGGSHWRHNGMTSDEAFELRSSVLKSVRINNSRAIYKSWQSPYEWPFVPEMTRAENIYIERLLDNLIFAIQDVDERIIKEYVQDIVCKLGEKGVFFD